jgi:hypothetical protein
MRRDVRKERSGGVEGNNKGLKSGRVFGVGTQGNGTIPNGEHAQIVLLRYEKNFTAIKQGMNKVQRKDLNGGL